MEIPAPADSSDKSSIADTSAQGAAHGLRRNTLFPMETLAQSVSTIAPTTTPAATIPLVWALAGNGVWLAYVLATIAVLLVALCISRRAISHLPDIFIPYGGIFADVIRKQCRAFGGIEIDDRNAERAQPIEAADEIVALAHK